MSVENLKENFVSFELETKNYDRPLTGLQNRQNKVKIFAESDLICLI